MRFAAFVTGAIAAFFVCYTGRLLLVTGMLQHTRVGGGGAFVGAVVFPLLAVLFGWLTVRILRRAGQRGRVP